jgi:hypothetical protein
MRHTTGVNIVMSYSRAVSPGGPSMRCWRLSCKNPSIANGGSKFLVGSLQGPDVPLPVHRLWLGVLQYGHYAGCFVDSTVRIVTDVAGLGARPKSLLANTRFLHLRSFTVLTLLRRWLRVKARPKGSFCDPSSRFFASELRGC